ncbi:MAG: ornithine carbamoyltransferase [Pseudomonadota bacterium]
MDLIDLSSLNASDVQDIWRRVDQPALKFTGTVGWSFEGNGIRTRTTFLQAIRQIELEYIELPNLLKSTERTCDLAGYLDPFYSLYVIRESNHVRLAEFAAASRRPVINAMSSQGHPCEVLADAYFIDRALKPLSQAKICLWGPTTNVLRSWHELAAVLGFNILHLCEYEFHQSLPNVKFAVSLESEVDVVITDSWPKGYENLAWSLSKEHLKQLGSPKLLPTPPFNIGQELVCDPRLYDGFVGYAQKMALLNVQKAIISYVLSS